jgi:hypothetical protein
MHPGGWGKPPVDEYGRPLYGDVFGVMGQHGDQGLGEEVRDWRSACLPACCLPARRRDGRRAIGGGEGRNDETTDCTPTTHTPTHPTGQPRALGRAGV